MVLREQIRSTPEYQALSGQDRRQEGSQAGQQSRQASGPVDALDPVLNWEKTDVEFWLQVAQLVVLLLILRELRGG